MYLGERVLEETIVFYAQCQDTDGSFIDAGPGNVTYAVYEEETGAAIFGGIMALLGGVGSGLYSEELALTAAAGFQDDAWYVIRITATVDGETPASTHTFKIMPASTPAAVADAVWDEAKAGHQGETIMGNIAEDLDAMETTVEEG
jgi:hypothetical protein